MAGCKCLTLIAHDEEERLMRLAIVYDIPMALNAATAERLIKTL